MRLYCTDEEFMVHRVPRAGVPFLVDSQAELVEPANAYLYEISVVRGRTRSGHTWRTYAKYLYEYFAFLEENGLEWDKVERSCIVAWRNSMVQRGNQTTTINHRLRGVARFYEWAVGRQLMGELPYDREEVQVYKRYSRHGEIDASGGLVQANELTLRAPRKLPRFLLWEEATRFVSHLRPHRNELIGSLMLLSGLRLEEAARLDMRVLPNPSLHSEGRLLRMNLDPDRTPTKGAVERVVYVPYDLGRQLAQYVTFARGPLLKEYRKRVGETQKSTSVFLNKHGEPVSLAGIQNEFQRASRESGVKATPHVLRHTYATYEFLRLSEREGRDRALLWVKDRLGHSSIQTTEIYLHAADLVSHEETDDYHAEIYAILRDGVDDGRKARVSKTKAGRETAPHRS